MRKGILACITLHAPRDKNFMPSRRDKNFHVFAPGAHKPKIASILASFALIEFLGADLLLKPGGMASQVPRISRIGFSHSRCDEAGGQ